MNSPQVLAHSLIEGFRDRSKINITTHYEPQMSKGVTGNKKIKPIVKSRKLSSKKWHQSRGVGKSSVGEQVQIGHNKTKE